MNRLTWEPEKGIYRCGSCSGPLKNPFFWKRLKEIRKYQIFASVVWITVVLKALTVLLAPRGTGLEPKLVDSGSSSAEYIKFEGNFMFEPLPESARSHSSKTVESMTSLNRSVITKRIEGWALDDGPLEGFVSFCSVAGLICCLVLVFGGSALDEEAKAQRWLYHQRWMVFGVVMVAELVGMRPGPRLVIDNATASAFEVKLEGKGFRLPPFSYVYVTVKHGSCAMELKSAASDEASRQTLVVDKGERYGWYLYNIQRANRYEVKSGTYVKFLSH
jgi:hypothetical protein